MQRIVNSTYNVNTNYNYNETQHINALFKMSQQQHNIGMWDTYNVSEINTLNFTTPCHKYKSSKKTNASFVCLGGYTRQ